MVNVPKIPPCAPSAVCYDNPGFPDDSGVTCLDLSNDWGRCTNASYCAWAPACPTPQPAPQPAPAPSPGVCCGNITSKFFGGTVGAPCSSWKSGSEQNCDTLGANGQPCAWDPHGNCPTVGVQGAGAGAGCPPKCAPAQSQFAKEAAALPFCASQDRGESRESWNAGVKSTYNKLGGSACVENCEVPFWPCGPIVLPTGCPPKCAPAQSQFAKEAASLPFCASQDRGQTDRETWNAGVKSTYNKLGGSACVENCEVPFWPCDGEPRTRTKYRLSS